jgi:hypothetical protein
MKEEREQALLDGQVEAIWLRFAWLDGWMVVWLCGNNSHAGRTTDGDAEGEDAAEPCDGMLGLAKAPK